MWWYSHSSVREIGLIDSLQRHPGWRIERPMPDLAHVVRLEVTERDLAHAVGLAEGPALELHHLQPTIAGPGRLKATNVQCRGGASADPSAGATGDPRRMNLTSPDDAHRAAADPAPPGPPSSRAPMASPSSSTPACSRLITVSAGSSVTPTWRSSAWCSCRRSRSSCATSDRLDQIIPEVEALGRRPPDTGSPPTSTLPSAGLWCGPSSKAQRRVHRRGRTRVGRCLPPRASAMIEAARMAETPYMQRKRRVAHLTPCGVARRQGGRSLGNRSPLAVTFVYANPRGPAA